MAIAATHIVTNGNNTDNSSYTISSITPSVNKLILLWVYSIAAATPNIPTVTGNGLTWVQVASVQDTGNRRLTLFRASMAVAPTTGSVTLAFGGQTQTGAAWSMTEFSGVDLSSPNGASAIVQSATNFSASTVTGLTATLAAFASGSNATAAGFGIPLNTAAKPAVGSGFTQLGQRNQSSPNLALMSEWKNSNDTTADATWAADTVPATAIAVELKASGISLVTFGRTTNSGSSNDYASTSNRKIASRHTASQDGVLKYAAARCWVEAPFKAKAVIYADSAGTPGALLATSDEVTISNTTELLNGFAFSGGNQINIVSGTSYWMGLIHESSFSDAFTISMSSTSAAIRGNVDTYSDGPANPFGALSISNIGPIDEFVVMELSPTSLGEVTMSGTSSMTVDSIGETGIESLGEVSMTGDSSLAADIITRVDLAIEMDGTSSLSGDIMTYQSLGEVSMAGTSSFSPDVLVRTFGDVELTGTSSMSGDLQVVYSKVEKEFYYKVLRNGAYITTLENVVSQPVIREQINTGGSEVVLELAADALNYDEGNSIAHNNEIQIWVSDKEAVDGMLLFRGYISKYGPNHETNTITVTLLGYGSELKRYIIEAGEASHVDQLTTNDSWLFGNSGSPSHPDKAAQTFTAGATTKITRIDVRLALTALFALTPVDVTLELYDGDPEVGEPIAVSSKVVNSTTPASYSFAFGGGAPITNTEVYSIVVKPTTPISPGSDKYPLIIYTQNTNPYAGGKFWIKPNDGAWDDQTSEDAFFQVFVGGGNTTATFNSYDPSEILRALIDDYAARGGTLRYTPQLTETLTNLITNPSLETNATGWTGFQSSVASSTDFAHHGTKSLKITRTTGGSGEALGYYFPVNMTLGLTYKGSVWVKAPLAANGYVRFSGISGSQVNFVGTGNWQFVEVEGVCVDTTETFDVGLSGVASGTILYADEAMVVQTDGDIPPYFDGSSTDDDTFTYAWTSTANASTSTRVEITQRSSIEDTGTIVSYEFNTNTVSEGFEKVLELAPPDWYIRIDQRTNLVHFHPKGSEQDHQFTLGKDIIHLEIEKIIENVVNYILFSGAGDPAFFKRYVLQESINKHGMYALRMKDERVSIETTADIMAARAMRGDPEISVNIVIMDSNLNELGYDIESVLIGQIMKVGGTGEGPVSKYDLAQYDVSPYDYETEGGIGTIAFQITETEYQPEIMTINVSTKPPDVNKRIQDIKRNQIDMQNVNNPSEPL